MNDWVEILVLLVSGGYLANIFLSGGAYVPQLLKLGHLYREGSVDQGLSLLTYAVWSLGAAFTVLYGLVVAKQMAMVWVGGSTLLLNLATLLLIYAVRRKHRQQQQNDVDSDDD